jgi:isopenicillin-N epimerase
MREPRALGETELRQYWLLDREVGFLNHGSFGACPIPVLEHQRQLRERLERQPVQFLARDLEPLLDAARAELASFIGAASEDLAWVTNATTAVNAVLQSLRLSQGDELLTTDHEYNACRNALEFVAERAGAKVVVVPIPFPVASPDEVVEAVLAGVTVRTRIALLDHVTSQTGLVLPVRRLVRELTGRGVDTLVDGAHAPGMLDLSLDDLGAAYYTGNCHKWLCAPKGAGFLHVRRDLRERVRPLVISHGANSPRTDRSRFHLEFDWAGTDDPTAVLCVPEAIRFMGGLLPGGWEELRRRNRQLALEARDELCRGLGVEPPCPDEMIGSMAALPLPPGGPEAPASALYTDPLQSALLGRFRIEVPIIPWPAPPHRLVRVSAQVYNRLAEYQRLSEALAELVSRPAPDPCPDSERTGPGGGDEHRPAQPPTSCAVR